MEERDLQPANEHILAAGHRTHEVEFEGHRLRIQKNGIGISDDELRATLDRYLEGEADAEDVAREYARARIVAHTGDFSVETADLDRLVCVCAECSGAPRIRAEAAAGLPETLLEHLPPPSDEPLGHPRGEEAEHHESRLRALFHREH